MIPTIPPQAIGIGMVLGASIIGAFGALYLKKGANKLSLSPKASLCVQLYIRVQAVRCFVRLRRRRGRPAGKVLQQTKLKLKIPLFGFSRRCGQPFASSHTAVRGERSNARGSSVRKEGWMDGWICSLTHDLPHSLAHSSLPPAQRRERGGREFRPRTHSFHLSSSTLSQTTKCVWYTRFASSEFPAWTYTSARLCADARSKAWRVWPSSRNLPS